MSRGVRIVPYLGASVGGRFLWLRRLDTSFSQSASLSSRGGNSPKDAALKRPPLNPWNMEASSNFLTCRECHEVASWYSGSLASSPARAPSSLASWFAEGLSRLPGSKHNLLQKRPTQLKLHTNICSVAPVPDTAYIPSARPSSHFMWPRRTAFIDARVVVSSLPSARVALTSRDMIAPRSSGGTLSPSVTAKDDLDPFAMYLSPIRQVYPCFFGYKKSTEQSKHPTPSLALSLSRAMIAARRRVSCCWFLVKDWEVLDLHARQISEIVVLGFQNVQVLQRFITDPKFTRFWVLGSSRIFAKAK